MSNDNEKKFYHTFSPLPEGAKENECRYKLVPTSKMHVRNVCDVMAKRRGISDEQRVQYADQAGYENVSEKNEAVADVLETVKEAVKDTENLNGALENLDWALYRIKNLPSVELHDVFSEYHVHAALAEALFDGFPEILNVTEQEDGWEVEISNQELFDRLDEGVVNEAFLTFSNNRSGIQKSLANFSQQ